MTDSEKDLHSHLEIGSQKVRDWDFPKQMEISWHLGKETGLWNY
jgi:hypothetical protein